MFILGHTKAMIMTQNDSPSRLSEILEDLIALRRACRDTGRSDTTARPVRPAECD